MIRTYEDIVPVVRYETMTGKLTLTRMEHIANTDGKREFMSEVLDLVNPMYTNPITPVMLKELNDSMKSIFDRYHRDGKLYINTSYVFCSDISIFEQHKDSIELEKPKRKKSYA